MADGLRHQSEATMNQFQKEGMMKRHRTTVNIPKPVEAPVTGRSIRERERELARKRLACHSPEKDKAVPMTKTPERKKIPMKTPEKTMTPVAMEVSPNEEKVKTPEKTAEELEVLIPVSVHHSYPAHT